MPKPSMAALRLLSLLVALTALGETPCGAAPPDAAPPVGLPEGWQVLDGAAAGVARCEVQLPTVPVRQAGRYLATVPETFPRPVLTCGATGPAPLPLAAEPPYVTRLEADPGAGRREPVLEWVLAVTGASPGGGWLAARMDVAPLTPPIEPGSPGALHGGEALRGAGLMTIPGPNELRSINPRVRPNAIQVTRAPPPRMSPILDVAVIDALRQDGLVVSPNGSTWMSVRLKERSRVTHRLDAGSMFGVPGRLIIAPVPARPIASLELHGLAPDGTLTSLGKLDREGYPWDAEATDIRERDGWLEVLLVLDVEAKGVLQPRPWGALLRRPARVDGPWVEISRLTLPGPATGQLPARLSFDDANPARALLDWRDAAGKENRASHPLALEAAGP